MDDYIDVLCELSRMEREAAAKVTAGQLDELFADKKAGRPSGTARSEPEVAGVDTSDAVQ